MPKWHRDDAVFNRAAGNKIVHNQVRAAYFRPCRFVVTKTMHQDDQWVSLLRTGGVVNPEIT